MKSIISSIAFVFAFVFLAAAESWQVTVSTDSVVVAPNHNEKVTTAWTNGATVAAGSYLKATNNKSYWTPNGGTATVEPTHNKGIVTGADSITWLLIGYSRVNLEIQSTSTGDVWIKRGGAAVVDKCTLLNGRGAARQYSNFSGQVQAIAGSSQTIVVQEW